jgi:hypothetical protein
LAVRAKDNEVGVKGSTFPMLQNLDIPLSRQPFQPALLVLIQNDAKEFFEHRRY